MVNPGLSVLIPLYIYPYNYPSPQLLWQPLIDAANAHPDVLFQAIVDPSNGPGSGDCPNSDYTPAIAALNNVPNIQTVGYVHTAAAYDCGPNNNYICPCTQPVSAIEANLTKYANWNSGACGSQDVHVDSIFFDEAPGLDGGACVDYMTNITQFASANVLSSSVGKSIYNPGYTTENAYFGIAPSVQIVVLETSADFFHGLNNSGFDAQFTNSGQFNSQSYVILTGEESDNTTLSNDVDRMGPQLGLAGTFISNNAQGDYTSFASDWYTFAADVDAVNS